MSALLVSVSAFAQQNATWKRLESNFQLGGGLFLESGYLAIRTAPAYKYENEINHIGLYNGEQVQVAGQPVRGTGINGTPATYCYVYAPKFGCYGYVNSYYLG